MDHVEVERLTAKQFGVDVAKITVQTAAEVVAAYALLLAIGYTYTKVTEFRARRAAKKTATEE